MARLVPIVIEITIDGTAQVFSATSISTKAATVQAAKANAGTVWVSNSEVTTANKKGMALDAMDSYQLTTEMDSDSIELDLNDWYVAGDNNGDKVIITYFGEAQ